MMVQVAVHDALAEPVDERQRERLHEPDVHAREVRVLWQAAVRVARRHPLCVPRQQVHLRTGR